jgi:hypothetical protein
MPQTKKIMVGREQVTLYTVDDRNWFSTPISCIETTVRLRNRGEQLRESWRNDPWKIDGEIESAGGDLGGTITLARS